MTLYKLRDLEHYRLRLYNVRDQLKRHVYERSREAFDRGEAQLGRIKTCEQLAERQACIRSTFLRSIGGLPERVEPLLGETVGSVELGFCRIERVRFTSRPGVWVTANLYLPSGGGPHPAVLFVCGHHDEAKLDPEYQSVCQTLAAAGLAVLAVDPLGQGERSQYIDPVGGYLVGRGVGEHDHAGACCLPLGDSLARYFLTDNMRAVDYLCSRPEIDASRIGVTGNSGGGTQTSMLMMADSRIAAAAPGTFITSRGAFLYADRCQDAEQIWPGFSAAGLDHADILLAMAPKPVLVLAAAFDFFPIEGTMDTVSRVRRLWELHEAGDRLELFVDDAIHAYTQRMAREAARFFAKHLAGAAPWEVDAAIASERIEPFERSLLLCTAGGQVLLDKELVCRGAQSVHDIIRERLGSLEEERGLRLTSIGQEQLRGESIDWLRDRVYRDRKPCELNPRLNMLTGSTGEWSVYNAAWWAQEGVLGHAMVLRPLDSEGQEIPATIAVWNEGTRDLQRHREWLRRTCGQGRAAIVLDVSGVGALNPYPIQDKDPLDFYEIIHKLACDLYWLDDSLAAMRVFDVLRAAEAIGRLPGIRSSDLRLYGSGTYGLYACLAAVLEPKLKFRWEDPMLSFSDWVKDPGYDSRDIHSLIVPGILTQLDLPMLSYEAAGDDELEEETAK
ncbi:alpha/beta hydrolase family protein [Paenibacillus koleovorans]|uniref:alpha/beta hydrolase family protein n=1 Tax=Paenibacillus koleovorans TaxID=121608 RepID=UPI0013E294BF|nr:acetylxylan esterase [Paenibacillus koleovorans]